MENQRLKAIFILLGTIFGIIVVLFWMFRWNQGTVVISANAPYSVTLLPKGGGKNCQTNVCELSAPPRTYTIKIKKEGYFEEERTITIKRWQKTNIEIAPAKIPVLKEDEKRVKNEKVERKNQEFILETQESTGWQALMKKSEEGNDLIVYFTREMVDADIVATIDGKVVAIIDRRMRKNVVYAVTVKEKKRTRLFEDIDIKNLKISPSGTMIAYEREDGKLGIFLQGFKTPKILKIKTSIDKITFFEERLIAAINQQYSKKTKKSKEIELEIKDNIREDFLEGKEKASEIFVEYLPEKDRYILVFEPDVSLNIHPENMESSANGIRFVSNDKFFELILK